MVLKASRNTRRGGLRPIGRLLVEYNIGDKVVIDVDPSFHKGAPHKRFHGKVGVIREKRGRAYAVEVSDGRKKKLVIARIQHLKLLRA